MFYAAHNGHGNLSAYSQEISVRIIPRAPSARCQIHPRSGNAKLQGLVTELELTGNRYNIALVRLPVYIDPRNLDDNAYQTMFFVVCPFSGYIFSNTGNIVLTAVLSV